MINGRRSLLYGLGYGAIFSYLRIFLLTLHVNDAQSWWKLAP
jgi:hypothetical protein